MLYNFKAKFQEFSIRTNPQLNMGKVPFRYEELLLEFGGKSFDDGLYTIHTFEDSLKWSTIIPEIFPNFDNKILPFAHDWLGRQFCIPNTESQCIFMFDPAQPDDYVLDENLFDFHDNILANNKLENLSPDLFEKTLQYLNIRSISYDECLGYKIPSFLNGKDELSNYEKINLEFYWGFLNQIYQQVKDLPDGTRINNVGVQSLLGKHTKPL